MVNAPKNIGQDWDVMIKQTRINIIKKLSRVLKVDLNQLINYESILDPRDIEKNTQSYQGSIYGAASHSKFSAFLRHPNFSSSISNLYFVVAVCIQVVEFLFVCGQVKLQQT